MADIVSNEIEDLNSGSDEDNSDEISKLASEALEQLASNEAADPTDATQNPEDSPVDISKELTSLENVRKVIEYALFKIISIEYDVPMKDVKKNYIGVKNTEQIYLLSFDVVPEDYKFPFNVVEGAEGTIFPIMKYMVMCVINGFDHVVKDEEKGKGLVLNFDRKQALFRSVKGNCIAITIKLLSITEYERDIEKYTM